MLFLCFICTDYKCLLLFPLSKIFYNALPCSCQSNNRSVSLCKFIMLWMDHSDFWCQSLFYMWPKLFFASGAVVCSNKKGRYSTASMVVLTGCTCLGENIRQGLRHLESKPLLGKVWVTAHHWDSGWHDGQVSVPETICASRNRYNEAHGHRRDWVHVGWLAMEALRW
jgi:hypothetical protein